MTRALWTIAAAIVILRVALAATLPMTGDEAYYWEWSRRLAAGYIDHPPAVAYIVALFSWLGSSPFAARFGFVLCGVGAALAASGAAGSLWRSSRAAAIAALAVTAAPMLSIVFSTVSPEGPATFAWALALYAGVLAFERADIEWFLLLGFAMGLALLSHFLSWALVIGVAAAAFAPAYRGLWRDGLWMSFLLAGLCYVPFLVWNAGHAWQAFAFALVHRHPSERQLYRPLVTYALCLAAFSPGLWIAATIASRRPSHALLTTTALPLSIALLVVSIHERVEAYWFAGPFLSLCVAIPGLTRRKGDTALRWWLFAPALLMSALLFGAGIAPFQMYAVATRAGLHLRNAGPFEIFTYKPLAQQVKAVAAARNAIVMTDGYGFSSLLDFYGGLTPVFIGYDAQGQEARRWYGDAQHPQTALFVDKAPLAERPDFQRQLARACANVSDGPTFALRYRTYYSTWCEAMRPHAIAILRFQR
ncbi:MAG: ArnT family glycosyltransferase [Candidatus Baltobacteraceae bacterium]